MSFHIVWHTYGLPNLVAYLDYLALQIQGLPYVVAQIWYTVFILRI